VIKPPFYPTSPPKGAPRLERMRFLRRNYIYNTVWVLPLLIVGFFFSARFILVVCAAVLAIEAAGAGVLELQIRSERRKGSS
jgi:hypothetical protein